MYGLSSPPENGRSTAFDRLLLICALLTLVCVLGAHEMDRLAQDGVLPARLFARAAPHPGVDPSATASIALRTSTAGLTPCGPN
ncbi:hypothetical protein [uncultured Rhodoblastus sp.]|uniref:hypothetical protein n=1 Tax=uncultured Rhodoblastus sp. TaxID=543037 RepID=UPI0025DCF569|nr:hypothetical protein [uncultured Rhodoblastus sp.]